MPSLPRPLHNRLRAILLNCSEFESNSSLRAVFVTTELVPFRIGVPEASSRAARVDALLAYLQDQRLSIGAPVLPYFLTTLRDRYEEGDSRRTELAILVEETLVALAAVGLERVEKPTVTPPVVPEPASGHDANQDTPKENSQHGNRQTAHEKKHLAGNYSLVFASILVGFMTGVLGNLVAAWIQRTVMHDSFTLSSVAVIIALTVIGLIVGSLLQRQPKRIPPRKIVYGAVAFVSLGTIIILATSLALSKTAYERNGNSPVELKAPEYEPNKNGLPPPAARLMDVPKVGGITPFIASPPAAQQTPPLVVMVPSSSTVTSESVAATGQPVAKITLTNGQVFSVASNWLAYRTEGSLQVGLPVAGSEQILFSKIKSLEFADDRVPSRPMTVTLSDGQVVNGDSEPVGSLHAVTADGLVDVPFSEIHRLDLLRHSDETINVAMATVTNLDGKELVTPAEMLLVRSTETRYGTFDFDTLKDELPLSTGISIPLNEIRSFEVFRDKGTLRIRLIDGTTIENVSVPNQFGRGITGLLDVGWVAVLDLPLQELTKVDFHRPNLAIQPTNSSAKFTFRDGKSTQTSLSWLMYTDSYFNRNSRFPLAHRGAIPFRRLASVKIESQDSGMVSASIQLVDGKTIEDTADSRGYFSWPTDHGVSIASMKELQEVVFGPNQELQQSVVEMATITTTDGVEMEVPAEALTLMRRDCWGSQCTITSGESIVLNTGIRIPLGEISSIEVITDNVKVDTTDGRTVTGDFRQQSTPLDTLEGITEDRSFSLPIYKIRKIDFHRPPLPSRPPHATARILLRDGKSVEAGADWLAYLDRGSLHAGLPVKGQYVSRVIPFRSMKSFRIAPGNTSYLTGTVTVTLSDATVITDTMFMFGSLHWPTHTGMSDVSIHQVQQVDFQSATLQPTEVRMATILTTDGSIVRTPADGVLLAYPDCNVGGCTTGHKTSLPLAVGTEIPLSEIKSLELVDGVAKITRTDGATAEQSINDPTYLRIEGMTDFGPFSLPLDQCTRIDFER